MEGSGKVNVRELLEFFNFQQITGDEKALDRPIIVPDINRPGLELAGFYEKSVQERIIIIGNKEKAYIRTRSEEDMQESYDYITSDTTPCIIFTHNENPTKRLMEIAQKKNFPILSTDKATNITVVDIIGFLDERLAHFDNVHGDLLSIFGEGVLITGKSGIGKSEIALDLISRGHVLVADDRVDCYRIHNEIIGTAPEVLKHYLELRGIGVIDVMRLYGARAFLENIKIGLVIYLEHFEQADAFERFDSIEDYETIMGVQIPKITIPVTEGRNMSVIIESAVINFNLKQLGTDSFQEFRKKVLENIERNK